MSDMHVTTGRVERRVCSTCGFEVEHTESRGIGSGLYHWSAVNHLAPCGAPCMGGGIGKEAREILKPHYAHWIDGVHGHVDHGIKVCPNGCEILEASP